MIARGEIRGISKWKLVTNSYFNPINFFFFFVIISYARCNELLGDFCTLTVKIHFQKYHIIDNII